MLNEHLKSLAFELIENVTDNLLRKNFLIYLNYAVKGNSIALQDLLNFAQTEGIEAIFRKLNEKTFNEFVETIELMSMDASLEIE